MTIGVFLLLIKYTKKWYRHQCNQFIWLDTLVQLIKSCTTRMVTCSLLAQMMVLSASMKHFSLSASVLSKLMRLVARLIWLKTQSIWLLLLQRLVSKSTKCKQANVLLLYRFLVSTQRWLLWHMVKSKLCVYMTLRSDHTLESTRLINVC